MSHCDRINSQFFPLGWYNFSRTLYFDSRWKVCFFWKSFGTQHPKFNSSLPPNWACWELYGKKWQVLFGLPALSPTVLVRELENNRLIWRIGPENNIERAVKGWLCLYFPPSSMADLEDTVSRLRLAVNSFKTQWEILISENRWHH